MSNLIIKELATRSSRIPELADLYAACFGENDGWGERAACWQDTCLEDGRGKITPYVEIGVPCPNCATPMTEAYPLEWTTNYINKELSSSGTIGLLGLVDGIVAGAAWAYEGNLKQIATKKYKGDKYMVNIVTSVYDKIWPGQKKTLHISEVFIAPNMRGNDYAQRLVNLMVDQAKYPVTSRTLDTSPMTTVFRKAGLNQILEPYSDPSNDQRVFYASPNI